MVFASAIRVFVAATRFLVALHSFIRDGSAPSNTLSPEVGHFEYTNPVNE
jgi:hypothetical protein